MTVRLGPRSAYCHIKLRTESLLLKSLCARKGLTVIAITSLKHSISVNSRHSSGKKLYEIADIVIDNHGEIGDACVEVPRIPQRTGPTSTIIGSLVLNLMMIQAIETCTELGKEAPIIVSQNLDGVDERNRALYMRYRQRIGELF